MFSDPGVESSVLSGHEDAVWGLAYSSSLKRLASCSADGTVRIWDPHNSSPCVSVFNKEKGEEQTSARLDGLSFLFVPLAHCPSVFQNMALPPRLPL